MSLYTRIALLEAGFRLPSGTLRDQFEREKGNPARGRIDPKAVRATSQGPLPPVWHWLTPGERKEYLRKRRIKEGFVTLYDRVFCEAAFIPRG